MVVLKALLISILLIVSKITERFGLKKVFWVSTSVLLILFGDTLIPAIFHVLHVLWEVVESVIEHFLEATFQLTPKQAEFIVAWMGILTLICAGLKLLYVAYRQSIVFFATLQQHLNLLKTELEAKPYKVGLMLGMLSLATYGASFLLL